MYIGVDYHGVIIDTVAQKQQYAFEMFGVDLAPEQCSRSVIIDSGILDEGDYQALLEETYLTEKALNAKPQADSVEALSRLSQEHLIHIVTGSDTEEMPFIRKWLAVRGLGQLAVSTVGYRGSKYIDEFDMFVDDKLKVLKPLRPFIPSLFLFDQPYNQGEDSSHGIQRVKSLYDVEPFVKGAVAKRTQARS